MEFKLNQNQIKIKQRESILAMVFVSLILLIGTVGIIGPKPNLARFITAFAFIIFFSLLIKFIRRDFIKTKQLMQRHRLITVS
jgi:uncharacterized membrane protein